MRVIRIAVIMTLAATLFALTGVTAGASAGETQVSAGYRHTCALTPSGAADCWGDNTYGQAGDHTGPYTQVSAGGYYTCALTPAGAADCWGENIYGEANSRSGPYTQISTGWSHTCGLTPSGAADCWGDMMPDQAGPYTQIATGYHVTCGLKPSGEAHCWGAGWNRYHGGPFTQISASYYHTCGLTLSGAADCWDDANNDQPDDQAGPYTQVSAGYEQTCALTPAGAADCWGLDATDHAGPYTQVSSGGDHTCALIPSGAADCWGNNTYSQADDQNGPYRATVGTKVKTTAPSRVHRGVKVTITGKLRSLDATCVSLQPVTLTIGTKEVGPKLTNMAGQVRFTARLTRTTEVSVSFAGTSACGGSDASTVIRVS